MSVLSWGKCKLETTPSKDGAPEEETWKELDVPKEDTTQITTTAGTERTATEEGGDVVDYKRNRNSYRLEFDMFVKKGGERPFEDTDGVVEGEHAFRITPEDEACEGVQIDRGVVSVETSYTTADGILLHHVVQVLKPKEGKSLKPYKALE